MISELKDNEILDFLMTTDFDGDYSPEELKYLLLKWRYFYRLLDGIYDRDKVDWEGQVRKSSEIIKNLENDLNLSKSQVAQNENLINQIKSRKLTWSERISGKIKFDDEN